MDFGPFCAVIFGAPFPMEGAGEHLIELHCSVVPETE